MVATESTTFSCDECGKTYRWKQELAGRKVRCKCGHVLCCPARASHDDLFELSDEQPRGLIAEGVAVTRVKAVVPLAYRAPKEEPTSFDRLFPNKTLDLYAPICLLAISYIIELVARLLLAAFFPIARPFSDYLIATVWETLIATGLMLVVIAIAVWVRKIDLGPKLSAMLKLVAISISTYAAMTILTPLGWVFGVLPFMGLAVVWGGGLAVCFTLVGVFFNLDEEDSRFCTCLLFIVQVALVLGLRWLT